MSKFNYICPNCKIDLQDNGTHYLCTACGSLYTKPKEPEDNMQECPECNTPYNINEKCDGCGYVYAKCGSCDRQLSSLNEELQCVKCGDPICQACCAYEEICEKCDQKEESDYSGFNYAKLLNPHNLSILDWMAQYYSCPKCGGKPHVISDEDKTCECGYKLNDKDLKHLYTLNARWNRLSWLSVKDEQASREQKLKLALNTSMKDYVSFSWKCPSCGNALPTLEVFKCQCGYDPSEEDRVKIVSLCKEWYSLRPELYDSENEWLGDKWKCECGKPANTSTFWGMKCECGKYLTPEDNYYLYALHDAWRNRAKTSEYERRAPYTPGKTPVTDKIESRRNEPQAPKSEIRIYRSVLERMRAYVHYCDIEINGMATVKLLKHKDKYIYLIDKLLPLMQQVCSGGHTELATAELAKWSNSQTEARSSAIMHNAMVTALQGDMNAGAEIIGLDIDSFKMLFDARSERYSADDAIVEIPEDLSGRVNCNWHSHVNMGCFWSGTDRQNARDLALSSGDKWQVLLVLNKKGDILGKVESSDPPYVLGDVPIKVIDDREWIDEVKTEIKEMVFSQSTHIIHPDKGTLMTKEEYQKTLPKKTIQFERSTASQNRYTEHWDEYLDWRNTYQGLDWQEQKDQPASIVMTPEEFHQKTGKILTQQRIKELTGGNTNVK